jgi:hypothetical protein
MTPFSLPIVRQVSVELEAYTRNRLQTLAKRLLAAEPTLNRVDMFGPQVRSGICDAPALFFEDHSEIGLFKAADDIPLEYRSFLLAGEDDVVLLAGRRFPEFEAYCHKVLGLGANTVMQPRDGSKDKVLPLSFRCMRDTALLKGLCRTAQQKGKFNVVPYMGTGNAWRLAAAIADGSGAEVFVATPPPRLTRRVNDKLWFLERVHEAFGSSASPLTYSVFGPAALAARIRALASRFARVAVKVPDSAGSLGNVMIRSEDIAGKSLQDIRQNILNTLFERGWHSFYPLMVGVWDYPVIASPSVNVWIPRPEEGPPVIEGLFTQAVSGDEAEFVGAEPSDLPKPLEHRIVWEASCLAHYFQNLGYFGQCGFDTILIGDSLENASVHWIECNGRWGGVSIPITVANRLVGNWGRKFVIIVQRTNLKLPPRPLQSILELLKGHLFNPVQRQEGVVLLAPGRLIDGSGLNLMVIGDNKNRARAHLEAVIGLLTRGVPLPVSKPFPL